MNEVTFIDDSVVIHNKPYVRNGMIHKDLSEKLLLGDYNPILDAIDCNITSRYYK